MNFQIIFTILVICASSLTSAKSMDEREVAEKIVEMAEDMFYIYIRIMKTYHLVGLKNDVDKLNKLIDEAFTSRRQKIIDHVTEKLGHCDTTLQPAITANSTREYTSIHDNNTGEELWNQLIKLPENSYNMQNNIRLPDWVIRQMKIIMIPLGQALFFNHFKEMGNKLWYILLLTNYLKIQCYSEDEVLKELWYKIPQPSTIQQFGNLNFKELWYEQTLPPLTRDKPAEPFAGVETLEEVWDKINYQLLFRRVSLIKFPSKDRVSGRWSKVLPTDILKHRDATAKKLWNELTVTNVIPKSGDDALMKLWNKLYKPLVSSITYCNNYIKQFMGKDFEFATFRTEQLVDD